MLLTLFRKACAANDRRRARNTLQDICDDRVSARRRAQELDRAAERALTEAIDLEREQFRQGFFGRRDPVHAGFIPSSAALFGITTPTSFRAPAAHFDAHATDVSETMRTNLLTRGAQ